MAVLENKIDFVVLVSAKMANVNGDPLNGNRPRTDYQGFGEMSDVCIKRKIRNRMQDLGHQIFVQSEDRCDDGCASLSDRAAGKAKELGDPKKDKAGYALRACQIWMDVRSFGQVFAFNSQKGVSVGVRGPVSIHHGISVTPVEVESMQITKSVNGDPKDTKSSDTMGFKHFVRFGLYQIKGSVNVQLAEKTQFSQEDAEVLKECLRTLFVNDASSARPEGSMEVVKVYWWQHNCKEGQHPSAKVHRSLKIAAKAGIAIPENVEDYDITLEDLEGLTPEILEGQ